MGCGRLWPRLLSWSRDFLEDIAQEVGRSKGLGNERIGEGDLRLNFLIACSEITQHPYIVDATPSLANMNSIATLAEYESLS